MTANPRMEPIRELLDASSDDEQTLAWPVPTRVFGFHGQQAVEKLLKVLILASGSNHEYIHDIEVLSKAAVTRGEIIPAVPFRIADLTDFAVIARYTASRALTPPNATRSAKASASSANPSRRAWQSSTSEIPLRPSSPVSRPSPPEIFSKNLSKIACQAPKPPISLIQNTIEWQEHTWLTSGGIIYQKETIPSVSKDGSQND